MTDEQIIGAFFGLYCGGGTGGDWANRAAVEFVANNPNFEVDSSREKHMLTSNHRGWLRRVK